MYHSECLHALCETFGNSTQLTSFQQITNSSRNFTARVSCNACANSLFFKLEKPFSYPRTQKHQIAKEVTALQLCHQHDIPVPKLISYGFTPTPWLLEEFLSGAPLSTHPDFNKNKLQISNEFYKVFQKLCTIRSEAYGDIFDGGIIGKHPQWKSCLQKITKLIYEDCQNNQLFVSHSSVVEAALQKALEQIEDFSQPVLYHCDLFSANVMGDVGVDGHLHLGAVIDFGMSLFAPLHYVQAMTKEYCDLYPATETDGFSFQNQLPYQILRIEPLLMMKLYHYPDTEVAVEQYLLKCRHFLNHN